MKSINTPPKPKGIDTVVLGIFEDQVLAGVDPSILELFFRAKANETSGVMIAFQDSKEAILRGARRKGDPEKVAYEVERILAAYLSIEDIS